MLRDAATDLAQRLRPSANYGDRSTSSAGTSDLAEAPPISTYDDNMLLILHENAMMSIVSAYAAMNSRPFLAFSGLLEKRRAARPV